MFFFDTVQANLIREERTVEILNCFKFDSLPYLKSG